MINLNGVLYRVQRIDVIRGISWRKLPLEALARGSITIGKEGTDEVLIQSINLTDQEETEFFKLIQQLPPIS